MHPFFETGHKIFGVDNKPTAIFFGPQGDTTWRLRELQNALPIFEHHKVDIRDRTKVLDLIKKIKPNAIVHTAAQPSHDKAASIPFDDFDVNAVGTPKPLEGSRQFCPESPFVHMSTNKVYGDAPNDIKLKELDTLDGTMVIPHMKKEFLSLFRSINVNIHFLVPQKLLRI